MSSREHCLFEPRSAPYLASLLLFSGHLSPADSIPQAFLPSLAFSSIRPIESSGYLLEDRKDGFIFFQASTLFCAFLPLWLHLSPGCPTLQGSSSSWTASISGPWNHPSSVLHYPILRCSSCLLCYPLSRCLTCLLGPPLQFPVPLATISSRGTPISERHSSSLDLYKSSLGREG